MSELLRPALELAVLVARRGADQIPSVDVPRRMRPFLRFERLSATALVAVRRAVDDSASFREQVAAAAVTEDDAGGRAPWLFLHRPGGWEDELAELEAHTASATEGEAEAPAQRRVQRLRDELARVMAELADVRVALAAAKADLAAERRASRAAQEAVAALEARVSAAEHERNAAHRQAAAARKAAAEAAAASASVASTTGDEADEGREPAVDVEAARTAVRTAHDDARRLQTALAQAERSLTTVRPVDEPGVAGAAREVDAGSDAPRAPGRLPAPIPPGLLEKDPRVAEHLVRLPAAMVFVDGYNATLQLWPDIGLSEQRRRLVDLLVGFIARTGAEVEVVFDGDESSRLTTTSPRRDLRVTFSPASVEADEVILGAVARVPLDRPVVVATDDRRVQRLAASRGANVVTQAQLFDLLGLRQGRTDR